MLHVTRLLRALDHRSVVCIRVCKWSHQKQVSCLTDIPCRLIDQDEILASSIGLGKSCKFFFKNLVSERYQKGMRHNFDCLWAKISIKELKAFFPSVCHTGLRQQPRYLFSPSKSEWASQKKFSRSALGGHQTTIDRVLSES